MKHPNKALANKALLIHPGLSGADKTVAGALIDHYNMKTLRCAPGASRLAKKTGLSISTIKKSIKKLTSTEVGLFRKRSRGGKWGTNRYEPNWQKLDAVRIKFETEIGSPINHQIEHICDPESVTNTDQCGTQTDTQNHSKNNFKNQNNEHKPYNNAKPESPRKRNRDLNANSRAKLKAETYSNPTTMSLEQHQIREKMLKAIEKDSPLFMERCRRELTIEDWQFAIERETEKPGAGIELLERKLGF